MAREIKGKGSVAFIFWAKAFPKFGIRFQIFRRTKAVQHNHYILDLLQFFFIKQFTANAETLFINLKAFFHFMLSIEIEDDKILALFECKRSDLSQNLQIFR